MLVWQNFRDLLQEVKKFVLGLDNQVLQNLFVDDSQRESE